jgi:hypothetical protein
MAPAARVGAVTALRGRIQSTFETLHQPVAEAAFGSSTGIGVAVIDAGLALDTPTFILITPWTMNGLAFAPDGALPRALVVDGKTREVRSIDHRPLGHYLSVNLVPFGTHFPSPAHAHKVAQLLAPEFRRAVAQARQMISISG